MFNFLKNLFANPYDKIADQILVEIKRNEAGKIEPDISEPVLSFVDCVKQNHRRFVLDYKEPVEHEAGKQVVVWYAYKSRVFKDRVTGEEWSYCLSDGFKGSVIWGCDFLTYDEEKYILSELGDFYHKRWSRLAKIRHIRKNRKNVTERERLKGIYCQ